VIAGKKGITFSFQKDSDSVMMSGDYDRLRQLFIIIIDNAIKFSGENSTIYLKLCDTNPLEVIIRDEGVGIAPEELPNIFDKFYKSKLRQNATGSGLGLVIAKQIVLKHEGEITVDSQPGEGTSFHFFFHKEGNLLDSVE
ncbi:MAG: ATP-binding protein, partial [Acetivibrio sp.]